MKINFKNLLTKKKIFRLTQIAGTRSMNQPRLRRVPWIYKEKRNNTYDNEISHGNKKFLEKRVEADFGPRVFHKGFETYESATLLKVPTLEPKEWKKGKTRVGTIARKLGHYPLYLKDGRRINTTVLQIIDNHVVKCMPAGEYYPAQITNPTYANKKKISRHGCLLVGSESVDPNTLTANYIGIFKGSGVPPTKLLCRFPVSKGAELPAGTPLNVTHYRVGDYVDVRGKT